MVRAMNPSLDEKYEALRRRLAELGSLAVGFSGGTDSALLTRVAFDVLGPRMVAVIADSPSLPRRELREARELAEAIGCPLEIVRTRELEDERYRSNPEDRCYFCKQEFFRVLREAAAARGITAVAYGENADDTDDWRPGAKAAREMDVVAPLRDVGLTKREIRELSRRLGLPTWDKPAQACLASRIPYGRQITPERLAMVEAAEDFLRDLGLREVRVRHHDGPIARIEVGPDEIERLCEPGLRSQVTRRLRSLGYRYVTLDLEGYRRGSLNVLSEPAPPGDPA